MRLLPLLLVALAATVATPAHAAGWADIGPAPRGLGTDGKRWAILVSGDSGEIYRAYDTRTGTPAATITLPLECLLGPIAYGRGIVRCHDEQRRLAGFQLVDLRTGAMRPLRRRGDTRGLAYDSLTEMGRRWATGLSCPSGGQRTCPRVYVNLRTGERRRTNDHRPRRLDSRRLARAPKAPQVHQTGPPEWRLVLQRPGRSDVTLRECYGSMLCWVARVHGGAAIWHTDDGRVHTLGVRSGERRSYPMPPGAPNGAAVWLTRSAVLATGADGRAYLRSR